MKNLARRMLRALYAAKLRRRSQPLALSAEGPTLVLAPHPDDEAFGCGALLARRAASGARVYVAYLTDGEASHPGHARLSKADIASLRRSEGARAMALIGIAGANLRFCGAPDGRLGALAGPEKADCTGRIAGVIAEVGPAEVLVPCRDDGSSEHEAAFRLLRGALDAMPGAPPRVLEFPVWSWWSPRLLARLARRPASVWRQPAGAFAAQKRALLECYPSQSEPLPPSPRAALPRYFADSFDVEEEFLLEGPAS